ncbi:MAG: LamG-like jellyroll fold domain-containing protein [Planctomycetota bacterium]
MGRLRRRFARRGSVYVLSLVAGSAIAAMAVGGALVRREMAARTGDLDDLVGARNAARSLLEIAVQRLDGRTDWRTALGTMVIDPAFVEADATTVRIIDLIDGNLTNNSTDEAWLVCEAEVGAVAARLTIRLEPLSLDRYNSRLDTLTIPLVHIPMDDSSGSTTADALEGAFDGFYSNAGIAEQDIEPDGTRVASFDSDGDVMRRAHDPSLETEDGTVIIWARPTAMPTAITDNVVVAINGNGMNGEGLIIADSPAGLNVTHLNNAGTPASLLNTPSLSPGRWHMLAYTFGAGGATLQVNGVQVSANPSYTDALDNPTVDADAGLQVGGALIPFVGMGRVYRGDLAGFSLVDGLTNAEVMAVYQSAFTGPPILDRSSLRWTTIDP